MFSFDVNILANDRCDISMDLKLSERVTVMVENVRAHIEAEPEEEFWVVKRG